MISSKPRSPLVMMTKATFFSTDAAVRALNPGLSPEWLMTSPPVLTDQTRHDGLQVGVALAGIVPAFTRRKVNLPRAPSWLAQAAREGAFPDQRATRSRPACGLPCQFALPSILDANIRVVPARTIRPQLGRFAGGTPVARRAPSPLPSPRANLQPNTTSMREERGVRWSRLETGGRETSPRPLHLTDYRDAQGATGRRPESRCTTNKTSAMTNST
jgi:hypothetical protein